MDILGAAHRIGHDFNGGMDALAPLIGVAARVLNNKLNPNCQTHHLTLVEAVRLQQITGKYDVLFAEADLLGYVCIARPDASDEDLSIALANTCAEFGDYMREVGDALRDQKITPNELKRLEKELAEMMGAASVLQAALAGKVGRRG